MDNLKNKPAPLFTLSNVEGVPVSLEVIFREHQFTLLVFLRHLG
jgi:hypothetical protein